MFHRVLCVLLQDSDECRQESEFSAGGIFSRSNRKRHNLKHPVDASFCCLSSFDEGEELKAGLVFSLELSFCRDKEIMIFLTLEFVEFLQGAELIWCYSPPRCNLFLKDGIEKNVAGQYHFCGLFRKIADLDFLGCDLCLCECCKRYDNGCKQC